MPRIKSGIYSALSGLAMASALASLSAAAAMTVSTEHRIDPPHCPPGQARQDRCEPEVHMRVGADTEIVLRIGDRFERDRYQRDSYHVVRDYDRHHLPAPHEGYDYVRVDEGVLLIHAATQLIRDVLD